jgi:hypothetical protein
VQRERFVVEPSRASSRQSLDPRLPKAPAMSSKLIHCAAAFFLLLIAPAAMAAASADASPTEILTGIYKEAVKGTTSDWLEPKRRGRYLSKSLASLWARVDAKKPPDGDVGPIDFDLTTDTNALELEGFDIKAQSAGATAAVFAVKLIHRKPYVREGEAIVTYDFIREGGHWRIDNIRSTNWSVRDLLERWLKPG